MHPTRNFLMVAITTLTYSFLGIYSTASAHGGEDHGGGTPQTITTPNNLLTAVSYPDTAEIFVKYAASKIGEKIRIQFFFSSYRTNVPFDPEKIEIELDDANAQMVTQPVKEGKGIYEAVIIFHADTSYTMRLTYMMGGEKLQTTIKPILAGATALKALQKDIKANTQPASSNSIVLWFIIGAIVIVAATFFFLRSKKIRRK